MTSLLMKVIICPLALIVSAWILPNVQYAAIYQPIIVGLILAAVGTAMEYMLLKKGTLWTSTLLDFVATVAVVYLISNAFPGAAVTFFGAIIVGLLFAVIEYFTHLWLIRSGRTEKSAA